MRKLNNNEQAFRIHPVGIKYICEFCHKGEMVYDPKEKYLTPDALKKHVCDKCGGVLMLPRMYPYIEWVPDDEFNEEEIYGPSKVYDDGK